MEINQNGQIVLEKRYLIRDGDGKAAETVDELFHRVAHAIAAMDTQHGGDAAHTEQAFYDMMTSLDFLPNSPTLMNAGLLGIDGDDIAQEGKAL